MNIYTYDELIEGMNGNMSDAELEQELLNHQRFSAALGLGRKVEQLIAAEVEDEYYPEWSNGKIIKSLNVHRGTEADLYEMNGIEVIREELPNGEVFLWFKSEDDADDYQEFIDSGSMNESLNMKGLTEDMEKDTRAKYKDPIISDIYTIIQNKNNFSYDSEGVSYLTQNAYDRLADIIYNSTLTQEDLDKIDRYLLNGKHGGYSFKINELNESLNEEQDWQGDGDVKWVKMVTKQVPDSDGFMTDYSMYKTPDGTYEFIFGDREYCDCGKKLEYHEDGSKYCPDCDSDELDEMKEDLESTTDKDAMNNLIGKVVTHWSAPDDPDILVDIAITDDGPGQILYFYDKDTESLYKKIDVSDGSLNKTLYDAINNSDNEMEAYNKVSSFLDTTFNYDSLHEDLELTNEDYKEVKFQANRLNRALNNAIMYFDNITNVNDELLDLSFRNELTSLQNAVFGMIDGFNDNEDFNESLDIEALKESIMGLNNNDEEKDLVVNDVSMASVRKPNKIDLLKHDEIVFPKSGEEALPKDEKYNLDESIFHSTGLQLKESLPQDEIDLYDCISDVFADKGFDVEDQYVQVYMQSVADYITMARNNGEDEYSIEDWFRDTIENYPEELEDLPKIDECLTEDVVVNDVEVDKAKDKEDESKCPNCGMNLVTDAKGKHCPTCDKDGVTKDNVTGEIVTEEWADDKYDELMEKGRENWDQADWDAYHYIEQIRFDSGYYEEDFDPSDIEPNAIEEFKADDAFYDDSLDTAAEAGHAEEDTDSIEPILDSISRVLMGGPFDEVENIIEPHVEEIQQAITNETSEPSPPSENNVEDVVDDIKDNFEISVPEQDESVEDQLGV